MGILNSLYGHVIDLYPNSHSIQWSQSSSNMNPTSNTPCFYSTTLYSVLYCSTLPMYHKRLLLSISDHVQAWLVHVDSQTIVDSHDIIHLSISHASSLNQTTITIYRSKPERTFLHMAPLFVFKDCVKMSSCNMLSRVT